MPWTDRSGKDRVKPTFVACPAITLRVNITPVQSEHNERPDFQVGKLPKGFPIVPSMQTPV